MDNKSITSNTEHSQSIDNKDAYPTPRDISKHKHVSLKGQRKALLRDMLKDAGYKPCAYSCTMQDAYAMLQIACNVINPQNPSKAFTLLHLRLNTAQARSHQTDKDSKER